MPLMPFSIEIHVPLLLDGRKVQTTRQPRKTSLKVGDVLYCYYKPRQKASCRNCIVPQPCGFKEKIRFTIKDNPLNCCTSHNNYFGEAVITSIIKVRHSENIPEYEMANYQKLMCLWDKAHLDEWAIKDGFKDFHQADKWFSKAHGLAWNKMELDIITFEPEWIKQEATA